MHGFLSLSLCSQLAGQATPAIRGIKLGINAGLADVRFLRPVPVGRRVRVRARVKSVHGPKPSKAGQRYKITWHLTMEVESEKDSRIPEPKPAVSAEWITLAVV